MARPEGVRDNPEETEKNGRAELRNSMAAAEKYKWPKQLGCDVSRFRQESLW